jgi:hypothetical protein
MKLDGMQPRPTHQPEPAAGVAEEALSDEQLDAVVGGIKDGTSNTVILGEQHVRQSS